jgi:signal transduction histidine kinase
MVAAGQVLPTETCKGNGRMHTSGVSGTSPSTATPARHLQAVIASEPFTCDAWRELLYALVGFPLALLGFVFTVASLVASAYLLVTLVGLPLLAVSSLGARRLGALNRSVARWLLDEDVPPPAPFRPRPGIVGWIRSGLADGPGWRARAYLVLKMPVAAASFVVAVALRLGGLWFALAPVQWAVNVGTEKVEDGGVVRHYVFNFGSFYFDTWAKTFLLVALGVVAWWVAPWLLRALLYLDRQLLADLLGPTSLSSRVRQLERTRAAVINDAAARLRGIERDLHDGAQAELVGLAMKLGLAKEKLVAAERRFGEDRDLAHARQLVEAAHQGSKMAISELRDLARGMHPPGLDQGLDVALSTLTARSPVPADVTVKLASRPSPAIEATIYFCAAELLTNVAKHASASVAHLELEQAAGVLRLCVTDNGIGGAHLSGGGLSGLAGRLDIVDGHLEVLSPSGGPTAVTVEIPLRS